MSDLIPFTAGELYGHYRKPTEQEADEYQVWLTQDESNPANGIRSHAYLVYRFVVHLDGRGGRRFDSIEHILAELDTEVTKEIGRRIAATMSGE